MNRSNTLAFRRPTTPLVLAAAAFVAAGGFVHGREWLDTYRSIPASVPGAAVVRVGFPVNAGVSALLVIALVVTIFSFRRFSSWVIGAALAFEAASLAGLILSRTASFAGWTEPIWTNGANQTRAVEIGAMVALTAVLAAVAPLRRSEAAPALVVADSYSR